MALLDITQRSESAHHGDSCTSLFTADLFTVAKLWSQPGCPTMEGWVKKTYGRVAVVHAFNPEAEPADL